MGSRVIAALDRLTVRYATSVTKAKALTNQSDLPTSVAKNQTIIGEEDCKYETRVAVSLLGARQGLHLHPRSRPFFLFSCQMRTNEVTSREGHGDHV